MSGALSSLFPIWSWPAQEDFNFTFICSLVFICFISQKWRGYYGQDNDICVFK